VRAGGGADRYQVTPRASTCQNFVHQRAKGRAMHVR